MAVNLPTPGGDAGVWDDKLNAAISAIEARVTALESGAPVTPPATKTLVLSKTTMNVLEGSTGTYTVKLSSAPTGNVTVTPASSDLTKATVSPATLTFTAANFGTAQTVTVTGVQDPDYTDIGVLVTNTAAGGGYDGKSANVNVMVTDTTQVPTFAPLVLMIGESNSGGVGLNSDLAPSELLVRPAVKIWDNINNDGFDDLHIGVNNLLGHAGLESYSTDHHGWEAGLANSVEAGEWRGQMYLVKAGQGASRIDMWTTGGDYWNKFVQRIDGAKTAISATGLDPQVYVFASLGINDHIAGTTVPVYNTGIHDWISRIREHLGVQAPVFFTEFPTNRDSYNAVLYQMDADDNLFWLAPTHDCPMQQDGNHWTAAGMKTIAGRFIHEALVSVGQGTGYDAKIPPFTPTPIPDTPTGPVVWHSLQNASAQPDGTILKTGANPSGGLSDAIAATDFVYETTFVDQAHTSATVVMLTQNSTPEYVWSNQISANGMVGGMYQNGGTWYWSNQYSDPVIDLGLVTSFPCKTRVRNVGTNLEAAVSYDDGVTYTTMHTETNKLAGKNALYIKFLAALETTGATLKVTVDSGVVPDLPPPDPTLTPVTWTNMLAGTDDGNGKFTATGQPAGALGGTVDSHNFVIQMDLGAGYTAACILLLDDDNTADFAWGAQQVYVAGMHQYNQELQASVAYTASVAVGSIPTNAKVRLRSDGTDDIVMEAKAVGDVSWTPKYRYANAALGKTNLYVKTIHAAGPGVTQANKGLWT